MFLKLLTVAYTALGGWAPSSTSLSGDVSHPPTGHHEKVFPDQRTFLLNVPEKYEHGVPHPLVLSFHGAGGNSSKQERITQLSDPSLRLNGLPFLSAYPQGVNNTDWNMTHIWQGAPYGNASVDDVGYTKAIIADISSTYTVDPRRIYISGKSNGGGFTALAACHADLSVLFAAFSPVSPALYPLTGAFGGLLCNPGRVVPVLHSHGVEDTDTPFHGRRAGQCGFGPEPDVRDWRRDWAARNARNAAKASGAGDEGVEVEGAVVDEPFEDVTRTTWSGDGWEVVGLSIEKLGHSWPSTLGLDIAGAPNQTATFNYTSEVLIPFFERHVLPEEYVRRI